MIYETIRVSSKGQITLPKRIREKQHILEGDSLLVAGDENKVILTKPRVQEIDDASLLPLSKRTAEAIWSNPEDDAWNNL